MVCGLFCGLDLVFSVLFYVLVVTWRLTLGGCGLLAGVFRLVLVSCLLLCVCELAVCSFCVLLV